MKMMLIITLIVMTIILILLTFRDIDIEQPSNQRDLVHVTHKFTQP